MVPSQIHPKLQFPRRTPSSKPSWSILIEQSIEIDHLKDNNVDEIKRRITPSSLSSTSRPKFLDTAMTKLYHPLKEKMIESFWNSTFDDITLTYPEKKKITLI